MTDSSTWNQRGESRMTPAQQRLLNSACGDLADQLLWHGYRLSKDGWRHFFSGTVMGFQALPAWDHGDGRQGIIMLGGSSLDMTKSQATDAIEMAFMLGDDPESQGIKAKPVRWCAAVCLGRYITEEPAPRRERVAA
jgi:hypothetical protein